MNKLQKLGLLLLACLAGGYRCGAVPQKVAGFSQHHHGVEANLFWDAQRSGEDRYWLASPDGNLLEKQGYEDLLRPAIRKHQESFGVSVSRNHGFDAVRHFTRRIDVCQADCAQALNALGWEVTLLFDELSSRFGLPCEPNSDSFQSIVDKGLVSVKQMMEELRGLVDTLQSALKKLPRAKNSTRPPLRTRR